MKSYRLLIAIGLAASLSMGQTVLSSAHFDCGPVGGFPLIGAAADCSGCTANLPAGGGVVNTVSCGFPTSGAQEAQIVANGPVPVAPGGPVARPLAAIVSELRIVIPANATGAMFDWEFFNAEGPTPGVYNDGMSIDVCDAAGNSLQNLVYRDAATANTSGCTGFGGTQVGNPGPQNADKELVYPRPAGAYLSVACWNATDNAFDSSAVIDNVQFIVMADDCSRAIPLGIGSRFFTNSGATPTASTNICNATTSRDVWFTYTNPHNCPQTVDINTCPLAGEPTPTLNDTTLKVWSGTCAGGLTCVTGNDDSFCGSTVTGLRSHVVFTIPANATYLISIGSFNTIAGNNFSITLAATDASKQIVGSGCGAPAPVLDSNLPRLGTNYVISVTGATPSSSGVLFYGAQTGSPTPLGGSCNLYLSNTGLNALFPFPTDAAGAFSITLPLPADPALDCLPVGLQAFIGSTNGIQLTNGLYITIGF